MAVKTEELISSICSLCGLRRSDAELESPRVFSKHELLLVQAHIVKLERENRELREEKKGRKNLVELVVEELKTNDKSEVA